jgi:hypothetical protein
MHVDAPRAGAGDGDVHSTTATTPPHRRHQNDSVWSWPGTQRARDNKQSRSSLGGRRVHDGGVALCHVHTSAACDLQGIRLSRTCAKVQSVNCAVFAACHRVRRERVIMRCGSAWCGGERSVRFAEHRVAGDMDNGARRELSGVCCSVILRAVVVAATVWSRRCVATQDESLTLVAALASLQRDDFTWHCRCALEGWCSARTRCSAGSVGVLAPENCSSCRLRAVLFAARIEECAEGRCEC